MAKRTILPYEKAIKVLEPYSEKITESIYQGFDDFQKVSNQMMDITGGYLKTERRTKACLIHDLIRNRVTKNFEAIENVETRDFNGIFGLKLGDELFIRFKKMNPDYSSSSVQTKQTKKYLNQMSIEGFPEEHTFLYAGYIPDDAWTSVKGIYLACWDGKVINWVENMETHIGAIQTKLELEIEIPQEEPTRKRVKLKDPEQEKTIKKTGTDE
jgi:hypothetical protein